MVFNSPMHRFFSKDSSRQLQQLESLTTTLGGVGIVFIQAPDKSLFVKSIVPDSSAWQSGVEVGDCLMKASRDEKQEFRACFIYENCCKFVLRRD